MQAMRSGRAICTTRRHSYWRWHTDDHVGTGAGGSVVGAVAGTARVAVVLAPAALGEIDGRVQRVQRMMVGSVA